MTVRSCHLMPISNPGIQVVVAISRGWLEYFRLGSVGILTMHGLALKIHGLTLSSSKTASTT